MSYAHSFLLQYELAIQYQIDELPTGRKASPADVYTIT